MRIDEAVLIERFVDPLETFFRDYNNKVFVYQQPTGKRDVIVHSIIDGKHEFSRKEGGIMKTVAKANHGSPKLMETRDWLIAEGYQFNKKFNWSKFFSALGFGALVGSIVARFKTIAPKKSPEDFTTFGLDNQRIAEIDPTINLHGLPDGFLEKAITSSVNRFGYLDLNTLEFKVKEMTQALLSGDYTIEPLGAGDAIKHMIKQWIENW